MKFKLAILLSSLCLLSGCWSSYWGQKHWWTSDGMSDSQRKAWQDYDQKWNEYNRTNRPVLVQTNQTTIKP